MRSSRRSQVSDYNLKLQLFAHARDRENELLASWSRKRAESQSADQANSSLGPESALIDNNEPSVRSSMTAHVWKVTCNPGVIIRSGEEVLVVLEAMKTEVNVEAGDENIGKKVKRLAEGVKQGALVQAGHPLVILE